MYPVVTVLHVPGGERPIGSYGVLLACALLLGVMLLLRALRRQGLDEGAVIASLGVALLGGFAGALVLHALVCLAQTGALGPPGLVYLGGLLGGLGAGVLAMRRLGLPVGRVLDLAAIPLLLAHAVGRVGCLLGGCCYGRPFEGPWAITYHHPLAPAASLPLGRHPSPLYEVAGLLLLALLLRALPPGGELAQGRRFAVLLAGYGALRLVIEHFRGDAVRGLWLGAHVSTSQLLSVALMALALGLLWRNRRAWA